VKRDERGRIGVDPQIPHRRRSVVERIGTLFPKLHDHPVMVASLPDNFMSMTSDARHQYIGGQGSSITSEHLLAKEYPGTRHPVRGTPRTPSRCSGRHQHSPGVPPRALLDVVFLAVLSSSITEVFEGTWPWSFLPRTAFLSGVDGPTTSELSDLRTASVAKLALMAGLSG